jgi:hypothetical protein
MSVLRSLPHETVTLEKADGTVRPFSAHVQRNLILADDTKIPFEDVVA